MKSSLLLRAFRNLPLKKKFMLMLAVLAVGIVTLCVVTAQRNHSELIQNERNTLHTRVEAALALANRYADRAEAGELSEDQAQHLALSALESLRSANGSDYVWVNDLHPTMLMHPHQKALNGTDLSNSTSADGKKIFVEMARLGRVSGGGFLDYTWPKPGTDAAVQKISYVGLHKRWGWIIGSGEYTDDIEARAWSFTRALIIACTLVMLSALLPCLYIARSILGPLSAASRAVRAVAEGDLSVRPLPEACDEIGRIHADIGHMVVQLRSRNERDQALATENLRIRTALDDVTTNIMISDADLNILYANRSLFQMLEKAEHDIRRDLPAFNTTTLIGANIDSFHKKPAHQRHVLGELRGTHRGQISLGDHVLRQIINGPRRRRHPARLCRGVGRPDRGGSGRTGSQPHRGSRRARRPVKTHRTGRQGRVPAAAFRSAQWLAGNLQRQHRPGLEGTDSVVQRRSDPAHARRLPWRVRADP